MAIANSLGTDNISEAANDNIHGTQHFHYKNVNGVFSCDFTVREQDDTPSVDFYTLDIKQRQKMTQVLGNLDLPLAKYFVAEFGEHPKDPEEPLVTAIDSSREGVVSSMKKKLDTACTHYQSKDVERINPQISQHYKNVVDAMDITREGGNGAQTLTDSIAEGTTDILGL